MAVHYEFVFYFASILGRFLSSRNVGIFLLCLVPVLLSITREGKESEDTTKIVVGIDLGTTYLW